MYSRGESQKNGVELRQFAKQQVDMMATVSKIDKTTQDFAESVARIVTTRSSESREAARDLVGYVTSDRWDSRDVVEEARSRSPAYYKDHPNTQSILDSLNFDSLTYRETHVAVRHARTYEWIFKEPRRSDDDQPMWSNFPDWLESHSSHIY
jgi:hypothetical protein